MAEISYREKVLLGYSPTTLSNSIHTSRRNSDVDFSDVFGGPPRLSITHEYYSDGHFSDSFDSFNVEDEGQRYRGTWLEKPVFGDEVVGTRRRYQCDEDNFYGDIFMGGDQQLGSCAQSPSRRDGFGSAPGSRVMSPLRPLSPVVEPFASPAKFSLPAPLANADFIASPSVSQSTNSPSYSTSRLNHTFQNHSVSRPIARSSYRPSPLSHQNSLDGKELASTENIAGGLVEPDFNKDSKDAEMSNNDAQFHFSIYKWAGKGVPSVMSIRKKTSIKERVRFDGSSRTNEGVKGSSLNSHQEDMVADTNDLVTTKIEESQSFDDISAAVSNAVSYNSSRNSKDEASDDDISHGSFVPREFPTLSKRSSHIDKSNDSLKSHANATKSYMKSLKFFFQSENGNEMEVPKMKGNESTVNKKGQPASNDDVPIRKFNESRASQSFREGKVDRHRSEGTNKVKEFVKIFNQEPSSKPKKHVLGRESRSSRWDEKSVAQEVNEIKSKSTEKHTKMQASKAKESKTLPKASKVEDGSSSMFEKQQFDVKIVGSVPASAEENDAGSGAAPNINATTESGFMDAELPQEIDMNLEVEHKEEIEDWESKILQWSKGKEGNIRALLSTLQYVLWPDSGWKSVPLVDIIEANAVKKAYQRALLRLHPDKLQQKGAAMHQKFIAEKVFDILQEAWDQFNSTGPI